MIKKYIKYSAFAILDFALVFFVAPSLINFHENLTTLAGFALWWLQPVILIMLIKSIFTPQKKDTNTHA